MHTKCPFGLRFGFMCLRLASFFLFLSAPLTLFIGHEQCIKANEQCFGSVNSNQKLFFYCFQFSIFNKISGIQTHTKSSKALLLCSFQIIQIGNNGTACKRTPIHLWQSPHPTLQQLNHPTWQNHHPKQVENKRRQPLANSQCSNKWSNPAHYSFACNANQSW